MSDAQLVRAAQNGDAASLRLLLERHRAALYALALRILGRGGAEAQDSVQDTFLVAHSCGCSPFHWDRLGALRWLSCRIRFLRQSPWMTTEAS